MPRLSPHLNPPQRDAASPPSMELPKWYNVRVWPGPGGQIALGWSPSATVY